MNESTVDEVRVFPGQDDQWYYQSKANNGQVLSTSEGYTRKEDAIRAAAGEFPGVILVVDEKF